MLAGAVAGLIGAWAMNVFAGEWDRRVRHRPCRGRFFCGSRQEREATVEVASRVGRRVLRRNLSRTERELGAATVHYATGAALGAGYALATQLLPAMAAGRGAVFGAAFWAMGDEVLLPSLGILRSPANYSRSTQLDSLGEHVAYGVTMDCSHRLLLRFL